MFDAFLLSYKTYYYKSNEDVELKMNLQFIEKNKLNSSYQIVCMASTIVHANYLSKYCREDKVN